MWHALVAAWALACASEPDLPGADAPAWDWQAPSGSASGEVVPNDELLVRASIDLRGVRPSIEEQERLAAGASFEELVDELLADPRTAAHLAQGFDQVFHTRIDHDLAEVIYPLSGEAYGLDDLHGFLDSVGGELPAMVERVIVDGLSWTEMVEGDWTMADATLDEVWPVQRDGDGTTAADGRYAVGRYTDDRPAAGALATNSLWWRYLSGNVNYNRHRAAHAARIFLCHDHHGIQVDLDPDAVLVDQDAIKNAIADNPSCRACHDTLEPLSGYLFGFWLYDEEAGDVPLWGEYRADRESMWQETTGVAPAYYGDASVADLSALGPAMAADERFLPCFVRQTATALLGLGAVDEVDTSAFEATAQATDMTVLPVARAIVLSDAYAALPLRMVRPGAMVSQVEELTGFRFTIDGVDQVWSGSDGLRVLAGDADGFQVTQPTVVPDVSATVFHARLAEAAARYAIEQHRTGGDSGLFPIVTPSRGPEDPAYEDQLAWLHQRVLGIAPTDDELTALAGLHTAVLAQGSDPEGAWGVVLAALLRDPRMLLY